MRYAFLLYADETFWAGLTPEQMQTEVEPYFAYTEALRAAGAFVAGEPLDLSPTAKTVRAGAGGVQDGPFADAKEQLGGFYLIEVDDLDAALDWAARCPAAQHGVVEVRPVRMVSDHHDAASAPANEAVTS